MMKDKNGMRKEIQKEVGKNMARNDAVSASAAFGYETEKVADPNAAGHTYEATYDSQTLQTKGIKDFQMSDDGKTASYSINPNDRSITNPDMLEMIDSVQNPHSGYTQDAMLNKYAKQGTEITMNSDDSWSITQHAKTSEGFAMTSGNQGDILQNSGGTSFVANEKNESFVPTPIRQPDIKQGSNINRIQSEKQQVLSTSYQNQVEDIKQRNPAPEMNESAVRGSEYAAKTNYKPQPQPTIRPTAPAAQPPVEQPVITQPPVAQPPVNQPIITQLPDAKPPIAQPPVAPPPVQTPQ